MSAIVKQLRDNAPADHGLASGDLMREAADVIERLRETLKWVSEQRWNEDADLDDICTRAEAALAVRQDKAE